MKLPEFPPDRGQSASWIPAAERQILRDREQKQVATAVRVALADLIYAMSEPNPEQE